MLDVWRAAAPSLAFLGPDLYVHEADAAMAQYATGIQPFFVPECRLSPAELVRAIGTYGAVGWSGYGLDLANPDAQLAATIAFVAGLETRSRRRRCEAASLPSFSNPAWMPRPGTSTGSRSPRGAPGRCSGGCCSMPG